MTASTLRFTTAADDAWASLDYETAYYYYRAAVESSPDLEVADGDEARIRTRIGHYTRAKELVDQAYDAFWYFQDCKKSRDLLAEARSLTPGLRRLKKLDENLDEWIPKFNRFSESIKHENWEEVLGQAPEILATFPCNRQVRAAQEAAHEARQLRDDRARLVRLRKEAGFLDGFSQSSASEVFVAVAEVRKHTAQARARWARLLPEGAEFRVIVDRYIENADGAAVDLIHELEQSLSHAVFTFVRTLEFDPARALLRKVFHEQSGYVELELSPASVGRPLEVFRLLAFDTLVDATRLPEDPDSLDAPAAPHGRFSHVLNEYVSVAQSRFDKATAYLQDLLTHRKWRTAVAVTDRLDKFFDLGPVYLDFVQDLQRLQEAEKKSSVILKDIEQHIRRGKFREAATRLEGAPARQGLARGVWDDKAKAIRRGLAKKATNRALTIAVLVVLSVAGWWVASYIEQLP